jgi:outer membrane protein assembly factor BamE
MTSLRQLVRLATLAVALGLTACVYRIDIQQGNLLEDADIDQVEVGMTRSQVQFLLGTPMVSDSFHQNRWDYAYYLQRGRSRDVDRRWVIVYFENDRVARVERDVPMQPPG